MLQGPTAHNKRDSFLGVIALSASFTVATNVLSSEIKWPGHEANHSPPFSAEDKIVWNCTSALPYACTA